MSRKCNLHVLWFQYHGGTNFGRTAGGPFIATSYDYDAPLDEYGMCQGFEFYKLLTFDFVHSEYKHLSRL